LPPSISRRPLLRPQASPLSSRPTARSATDRISRRQDSGSIRSAPTCTTKRYSPNGRPSGISSGAETCPRPAARGLPARKWQPCSLIFSHTSTRPTPPPSRNPPARSSADSTASNCAIPCAISSDWNSRCSTTPAFRNRRTPMATAAFRDTATTPSGNSPRTNRNTDSIPSGAASSCRTSSCGWSWVPQNNASTSPRSAAPRRSGKPWFSPLRSARTDQPGWRDWPGRSCATATSSWNATANQGRPRMSDASPQGPSPERASAPLHHGESASKSRPTTSTIHGANSSAAARTNP